MPSAFTLALGKVTIFQVAECFYLGTRQSNFLATWKLVTLPSAKVKALGKNPGFAEYKCKGTRQSLKVCRVPQIWHSANPVPLLSVFHLALGEVSINRHCARLCALFCRERTSTRQSFAECPKKDTQQRWLRRHFFCRVRFAFAEWKSAFAECLGHSAKRLCPVVNKILQINVKFCP